MNLSLISKSLVLSMHTKLVCSSYDKAKVHTETEKDLEHQFSFNFNSSDIIASLIACISSKMHTIYTQDISHIERREILD